ncbi:MAG: group II intron reverse transcriptase/maturase [Rectinema sp.]
MRAVEIPKPDGGVRQLGIPTVMDRMIQQALHQKLEGVFEPEFSDSSFGFRQGRSTHQAILQAQEYVRQGYDWVVDIDLEKFFDNVNHDILMARIAKKVADKRILKLLRNYLQAGIMSGGVTTARKEGTPQGSPLSPLLSNIMLTGLDRELERRGHRFCRYADDCNIYVKSERAGQRVMESITAFLAKRLKLKVNAQKSRVGRPWEVKYLGFSMTVDRKRRLKPAKRSVDRLKEKIRELMRKGRGRSVAKTIAALNPILRGWAHYCKICEVTRVFEELDGWVRRKVRSILWRQWKQGGTRFRYLLRYGLDPETAKCSASNGRGPWRNAGAAHMNRAISVARFQQWGLVSLLDIVSREVN